MKKAAVLLFAVLILASGCAVYAAGGTASDPLISLNYLNNTWMPDVLSQTGTRVNTKTQSTYQTVLDSLNKKHADYLTQVGGAGSGSAGAVAPGGLTDTRYKKGDVLSIPTGTGVLLLAGGATVGYTAGGAVVDVTEGRIALSGASLAARHRYLAGENTSAAVTITSDTAVLSLEGNFTLSPSTSIDYNKLAGALQSAGMFQGTGTGYGSGYDLEVAPTRIVGLVMFLRMMGEEDAALAYTGTNPFADTPEWCRRYAAYAYSKGYTKGVGQNAAGKIYFGTNNVISAGEYMTFVLRALGYTDSGVAPDFAWNNAVEKSVEFGVLNAAEQKLMTSGTFLRAQVVYVSCFALSAPVKDTGGTLLDRLLNNGSLKPSASAALSAVASQRIS